MERLGIGAMGATHVAGGKKPSEAKNEMDRAYFIQCLSRN